MEEVKVVVVIRAQRRLGNNGRWRRGWPGGRRSGWSHSLRAARRPRKSEPSPGARPTSAWRCRSCRGSLWRGHVGQDSCSVTERSPPRTSRKACADSGPAS